MPAINFAQYKIAPQVPQQGGSAPSPSAQSPEINFSKYKEPSPGSSQGQLPSLPPAQGFTGSVKSDFAKRVDTGSNDILSKDSTPSKVAETLGEGAGFVGDVGNDALAAVGRKIPVSTQGPDPAMPSLPTLTDTKGNTPRNLTEAISAMMQHVGNTAPAEFVAQKVSDFSQKHPEAARDLGALINIGSIVPEGGAADAAGESAMNTAKGAVEKVSNIPKAVEDAKIAASSGGRIPTLEKAAERVNSLPTKKTKVADSEGSAIPMKQGIGKSTIENPASLHEQYYNQEKKALADTKEDTALGSVGSDMGKAFDRVVALKQKVGSSMGEELKKVGGVATNISKANDKIFSELEENGLKYNPKTKTLTALKRGAQIPVTTSDKNLLKTYLNGVKKLGATPTVKNLDSFLKRVPDDIKVYKAKNSIMGTTNGERIIKNHLKELRNQFDPAISGKELTTYNTARKQYSKLSKFVEEGIPFLGKKTSAGDFAKDASIVKSSVQSVLNNGKKDWLLRLEELTGEPILDKATLALQAMKDAGDYRGESLLNLMSEGGKEIPVTPHGITSKIISAGVTKAKNAALGSPFEQTQRYLKSLPKTK